jgi:oligoendopeptidase F
MQKLLTRADVEAEATWDLADLFATRGAWLNEVASIEDAIASVTAYRRRLDFGGAALMACLEARDALRARLHRVRAFAGLRAAEDGADATRQADAADAAALCARVEAAISFVDSEIAALPRDTIESHVRAEPGLDVYRRVLEKIERVRPHLLSAETERVLASFAEALEAPETIYARSKQGDMTFAAFMDPAGLLRANSFNLFQSTYEASPDTAVRRAAWTSFCDGLARYQHTFAATFATEIRKNVVAASVRGYPSAEAYLLHEHEVPIGFYENVIEIIGSEVAAHMRRYALLRKRVLGLDKLLYCDIKAPLDPAYEPNVTFEQAGDILLDALAPMGAEYLGIMRSALHGRWVDRANNIGKASGAFCATPYGVHSFILMSWSGSMRDVFTLAHELGHAGHFMLAGKHQRYSNRDPAMPFVEAPSLSNEALLTRHLLAQAVDPKMRRWVLMQALGTYHHNFVTHLLEAILQRRVYALSTAGEPVTAARLNALTREILKEFWRDTVEIDDGAALTWMRQPHYYMGLYPYTYSAGLIAATALAEKASTEGSAVYVRWLDVLRAGGTLPPLELMRLADVDLASPATMRGAVAYVGELVDELEQLFSA